MHFFKLVLSLLIFSTISISSYSQKKDYDLSKDTVLFTVGYSHLDTEWRWE
jgi:alpha-mannosidase